MQAAHGAEEPPSEDIIDALVAHLHDPKLVPTLVGKLFPIYPLLSSPADTKVASRNGSIKHLRKNRSELGRNLL
jgi:hypothetical protein